MDTLVNLDQMSALTKMAFQYGPFLFALIFNLVLTRWGYKMYNTTCSRQDPPASDEEKSTYRTYFIGVAAFGIILVMASIGWWWTNQPNTHIYRGTIERLNDYDQIATDQLYVQTRYVKLFNDLEYQNVNFIITQEKPFSENQQFSVLYRKGREHERELQIPYVKDDNVIFRIEWDDDGGKYILKQQQFQETTAQAGFLLHSLQASPPPELSEQAFPVQPIAQENAPPPDRQWIMSNLQYERADIGSKISALQQLANSSDDYLQEILSTKTEKEPFILTVLDYTRHSDPEVSYHARRIVEKRITLSDFLIGRIRSGRFNAGDAQTILLRIPEPNAREILNRIYETTNAEWAISLRNDLNNGRKKTHVLVPTGSSEGDRYYMRTTWSSNSGEIIPCLAELFTQSSGAGDPMDQELAKLRSQNERVVYKYSKRQILDLARGVEACGAQVAFIGFGGKYQSAK